MASKQLERLKLLLGDATIKAAEKTAANTQSDPHLASSDVNTTSNPSPDISGGGVSLNTPDLTHSTPAMNSGSDIKSVWTTGSSSMAGSIGTETPVGQLAPFGTQLCPIVAVSKFPYTHMNARSRDSERVSQGFFANGRFWERPWHL